VITREPIETAQPTVENRVGTRVPETAQFYAVPREVAVEVPALARWAIFSVASNLP
jgi:hypothetical protein